MILKQACIEIVETAMKLKEVDNNKLNSIKNKISKKYHLGCTPTNIEILENLNDTQRKRKSRILRQKERLHGQGRQF